MKWGAAGAREARPLEAAAARQRRRAHQPRSVDVVPRAHRRRPVPDRRHVVADRDRRHHDQPAPRRHDPQARLGHLPAARASRPRWSTRPATASTGAAATSPSPARGRRCCAASTAIPSATSETYWAKYGDRYFAGDGCKLDDDGYLWLLGRVDDVMNVSGHRISTTEVESALVDHPAVAEAAVVGANDAVTGQAIMAYVIARGTHTPSDELGEEVRQHVAKKLGAIARPKTVIFTDELPEDPLRQDHAPPPARRRRGPLARRHHHARRPQRGRGDQAPGRGSPDGRLTARTPEHWRWRDGPVEPGPAVVFDMDGVLSDASGSPAPPRATAPQLGCLLRGGRRGRAHRGGGAASSTCSTRACASSCSPPARSASSATPSGGSSATTSAGTSS